MIVCADDYGFRDDIDLAILDLCRRRKVSAVSCMVVLERCHPAGLDHLFELETAVDIGLHLCLTDEGMPWSLTGRQAMAGTPLYRALMQRALTGRLDVTALQRQIAVQYQLFVEKTGRTPDHIDGHLHSHQLPAVREALIRFLLTLPAENRPYIRNTALPLKSQLTYRLPWLKAFLIGLFGQTFQRKLIRAGVRTNQAFAGIYDFSKWPKYPDYLSRFTRCLASQRHGILVVHPGTDEDWRKQEYLTLREFRFLTGAPNRFQN